MINKFHYDKIQFHLTVVLLFFISCGDKNSDYVFQYSNEQPESAIRSQSMLYFNERLEKETNGKI